MKQTDGPDDAVDSQAETQRAPQADGPDDAVDSQTETQRAPELKKLNGRRLERLEIEARHTWLTRTNPQNRAARRRSGTFVPSDHAEVIAALRSKAGPGTCDLDIAMKALDDALDADPKVTLQATLRVCEALEERQAQARKARNKRKRKPKLWQPEVSS